MLAEVSVLLERSIVLMLAWKYCIKPCVPLFGLIIFIRISSSFLFIFYTHLLQIWRNWASSIHHDENFNIYSSANQFLIFPYNMQTVELYYSKNAGYSFENLGHLLLITIGTLFTCGMFIFACFPELSAVISFKKNFMGVSATTSEGKVGGVDSEDNKWEDDEVRPPTRGRKTRKN